VAEGVRVRITDRAIISALNTPGGAVNTWRTERAKTILDICELSSPVNDPLNATHRGGFVGEFKRSWFGDARGSSGHHVVARIYNTAPHAVYVEEGRSASQLIQTFSWTVWDGRIRTIGGSIGGGTGARLGRHILRDAVNEVGEETGDWGPLL
jgi:hypothetical protein